MSSLTTRVILVVLAIVVLAVILIFFGGKRIPEIMKGFGEGIRSFKDGMAGTSQTPPSPPPPADKPYPGQSIPVQPQQSWS